MTNTKLKDMNPLVSLIIPIYNVSEYVERSLSSAFDQSYKQIEYLLIDDRGDDDSMNKVHKLIKRSAYCDRNIRIIQHNRNMGVSVARNTGIKHSSGEFLFFLDSDDILTINCIELHIKAIMETSSDFTVGGVDIVGSQSIHIKKTDNHLLQGSILMNFFNREWDNGPWNKLIRREFIFNNSLFFQEGIRYEDMLWGYNISKQAHKVQLLSVTTYKYMIHKGSFVTSKNTRQKVLDLIFVLQEIGTDKINEKYLVYRDKYLSFWKFNAAILLINLEDDISTKNDLYKLIRSIKSKNINLYYISLLLPFSLFYIFFSFPYYLYKTFNLK